MEEKSDFKSRSTRSSSNLVGANSDSYEFDFTHSALDPDLQLQCVPRNNVTKDVLVSKKNVQNTRSSINKMVLDIEHHDLEADIKKKRGKKKMLTDNDTYGIKIELSSLPDSIYEPFHKKMLRQELKMIEADVKEGYESAEHLEQLYNKLEVITWPMALQKMTKINDPTDDEELNLKKKMTMDKIMSMLDKYKLMTEHAAILKSHKSKLKINPLANYNKIYKNIDRMFIENYESSSDEEEENLTVEQIREHRLKKRAQKCGGTITIGLKTFNNTEQIAIIAEPLRNPYVIKLTSKERRELEKREPQRKVFKYSRNSKNVATLKEKRTISFSMKLNESERKRLIKEYNDAQLGEDAEEIERLKQNVETEDRSKMGSGISEIPRPGTFIVEQQYQAIQPAIQLGTKPVETSQFPSSNILPQRGGFHLGSVSQPMIYGNHNSIDVQDRNVLQNILNNQMVVQNNYMQQQSIAQQNHVLNGERFSQESWSNNMPKIIQQEMYQVPHKLSQTPPAEGGPQHRFIKHITNSTPFQMMSQPYHTIPIPGQQNFRIQQLQQPITSGDHGNIINNFNSNTQQIAPQKRTSESYTEPNILIPHKKSKIKK